MTFYDVFWADGKRTRVVYTGLNPRGAERWYDIRAIAKRQENRTDKPDKIVHCMSGKTVWREKRKAA